MSAVIYGMHALCWGEKKNLLSSRTVEFAHFIGYLHSDCELWVVYKT